MTRKEIKDLFERGVEDVVEIDFVEAAREGARRTRRRRMTLAGTSVGDRRDDPTAANYTAEDLVLVQRDIGKLAQYTIEMGASIAVNGTCLTATAVDSEGFSAEAMNQTLSLTALGDLTDGDRVNLELAAKLGDRLGGHLVQGHVDAVGTVTASEPDGFSTRMRVELPARLAPYLIEQGSITLNGVSLTLSGLAPLPEAGAETTWVEVSLIPETKSRTNLGEAAPGTRLNVECDMIAKYLERQQALTQVKSD